MPLSNLYEWYAREKRLLPWRETNDPYRIWLSEIILQQTRVQQGLAYWWRFVERFPTVEALAKADEAEVLLLWQGLGYYSRARNLHKAAQMIVQNGWAPFPSRFEDVIQLPGVGEYTAGAIMSFAYNAPYPAADGNVYRVLARLFDSEEPFDTTAGKKYFRQLAWDLLDKEQPRLHNSAIMELGAIHCTPGLPDCEHCPLMSRCQAFANGTVEWLPVRKERPKLVDRYMLYQVCIADNETLLHQRTEKDIWQHLWEFPLTEYPSQEALHQAAEAADAQRIFEYKHVLSHRRLHAVFVVKKLKELPAMSDFQRIQWAELDNYAFSRLTLRFLEDYCK